MEKTTIQLVLGAAASDIHKQLDKGGLAYDKKQIKICQKISDAISLLRIKGYISESAANICRGKLTKEIQSHVK